MSDFIRLVITGEARVLHNLIDPGGPNAAQFGTNLFGTNWTYHTLAQHTILRTPLSSIPRNLNPNWNLLYQIDNVLYAQPTDTVLLVIDVEDTGLIEHIPERLQELYPGRPLAGYWAHENIGENVGTFFEDRTTSGENALFCKQFTDFSTDAYRLACTAYNFDINEYITEKNSQ